MILVRLKATEDKLPSLEQKITFTHNLFLGNVVLNAGKLQLENTSTLMEYSLDSSNGEDGTWYQCTTPNTSIPLKVGVEKIYVREKAKPRNSRPVTENAISIKTFDNGNEYVNNNLSFNVKDKTISIIDVKDGNRENLQNMVKDLQYKIGNGNWINVDYVDLSEAASRVLAFNVNFVPGDLEFRLRGDENHLPSKSILKDTILAPASPPNVAVGFDKGDYRNMVKLPEDISNKDLEYSLGSENGPWISGEHLDTEDLVGKVYIRTKANKEENTLPSLAKELEFTPVLNLRIVGLSTHVKPYQLNGVTDQIEYRINEFEWKTCEPDEHGNSLLLKKDGTHLDNIAPVRKIEIRDKNQHDNIVEIYSEPVNP